MCISEVQPGHTHDLAAARTEGAVGALYAIAANGLPTLADKAYQGAGIGIHTPSKNPPDGRALDNRCHNMLLTGSAASANAPQPCSPPAGKPWKPLRS